MSNGDTHVRPGEVISSSLINQMLDRLTALENAATGPSPGPTGPIVMDGFEPDTEVPVGRLLAIVGSNLPFPVAPNSVTIGGFPVPVNAFLPTSTTARLEFVVPDLGFIPPEGRDLIVRVRSGPASAQRTFHFMPPVDTAPVPNITGTHPPNQPENTPVQMGQQLVVTGTNFAATPANNVINLRPLGIPNANTYPLPGNTIAIDAAASGPQQIVFTVPNMTEITGPPRRVQLQIRNGQNPTPGVAEFFAFR